MSVKLSETDWLVRLKTFADFGLTTTTQQRPTWGGQIRGVLGVLVHPDDQPIRQRLVDGLGGVTTTHRGGRKEKTDDGLETTSSEEMK